MFEHSEKLAHYVIRRLEVLLVVEVLDHADAVHAEVAIAPMAVGSAAEQENQACG